MKNQFFQIIRGLCIISVVLIHSLIPNETVILNNETNIIIRSFVNFSVGIFIFMAGYFVKTDEVRKSSYLFYKRKIKRLIIPYLVWTTIYIICIFYRKNINVRRIVCAFLLGNSSAQMYYIIVLIQLIIITPVLIRLMDKKSNLANILILSISLIYTAINGFFNFYFNKNIPLYATLFIAWITFYYLGILVKNNRIKIDNLTTTTVLKGITIVLVLNVIINLFEYKNGLSYAYCTSQIKISNSVYIILVILLIISVLNQNNIDKVKTNSISKIGDLSFGIYLVHMIFIKIFNKLFENFNIIPIGKSIVVTCLTLLASIICINLCNRVTKNKIKEYIGF